MRKMKQLVIFNAKSFKQDQLIQREPKIPKKPQEVDEVLN